MRACATPTRTPPANLLLGPTSDHTYLAQEYSYRTSWPSIDAGYQFDDLSTYMEVIYDDQSHYDELQGGYYRESISVRSGAVLR